MNPAPKMNRFRAMCWNRFRYESLEYTRAGIRVTLRDYRGELVTVNLPDGGPHAKRVPGGREIDIREWLALKVRILEPLEEAGGGR